AISGKVNIIGQLNLLEAVVRHAPEARVLVVGSGDEYGMVKPEEVPIAEDQPFRPNSPYAVSKVAQDMLGLQYFLMHKVSTIRVRPFNHIGPRQARGFVVADFARQIAEIEAGACAPVVRVGNLNAERDFTDVRDMVRAYHLAITQGAPGDVYNLGSGATTSIKNMLNDLLSLSSAAIEVVVDPARLRPSDMPVLSCDSTKFRTLTGWTPMISLKQSLQDVLDYWRQAL
ncbi:MAG: GDP-mannose 4,6-dehydratase, partial [Chloroflexi bacterium]|nr:GDP-mannose 4,6-dehydratase [Chloroflexota bacterium]